MGDIADMTLDGVLCEGCGVYMGDECGYPRRCRSCQRDIRDADLPERVPCPTCGKRVKRIGLANHQRDAHDRH